MHLASGHTSNEIHIWDIATSQTVGDVSRGHNHRVCSLSYSPDGTRIVSASADSTLRLWDITGNPVAPPLHRHSSTILSVAFSPDGTRVASAALDDTVRIWNISDSTTLTASDDSFDFRHDSLLDDPDWVPTPSSQLLFFVPVWHRLFGRTTIAVIAPNVTELDLRIFYM